MRRLTLVVLGCVVGTLAVAGIAAADDQVTGEDIPYVRHDGGSDTGIGHCNSNATDYPNVNPDTATGDADANDGGHRRQGNEPYTVVDPTNPMHVYAGWNDYCLTDLGAGWQGFGFSTDGGATWTSSLVPGYPQDTSREGTDSPLFGKHTDAGDPVAAFDRAGNLFVGGIAFNRVGATNGDVYVATYGTAPSGALPVDYLRTVVVGKGTPSRNFQGIFQDKPMLEVDRTEGANDGNVYVCWSRFTGFGQNKVYFSYSRNHGATFSQPISISRSKDVRSVQGCDIAIESDGDVYVTFRTFDDPGAKSFNGLAFARSANGGQSFSRAELIRTIVPYAPFDTSRQCGDGPFLCPSDFVFHRVPLEPRVTADQSGALPGVYLAYNEVDPNSIEASDTSYFSAGGGRVGQSKVYVIRTLNNGGRWSAPMAVDDADDEGHQFLPDIDAWAGKLGVVWQDNRTDEEYSVQFPIGNRYVRFENENRAISSGREEIVNSYFASLANATPLAFGASQKVSEVGHQSQYEMFGSRNVPFHGDYNWVSIASRADGSEFAYMGWTDNRDVVEGDDERELAEDGFDDNFDVRQCRKDLGEESQSQGLGPEWLPLSRRDQPFTGDNCGNAGGLDQNIYGAGVELGP
ncbi:MAG: sialidase family protein [Gaiellaceae bacterium]